MGGRRQGGSEYCLTVIRKSVKLTGIAVDEVCVKR